jgi:lysophospholipase
MELHEIQGFSAPPGAVAGELTTADGVRLRFARWTAPRSPRGTVCVISGRSEMIERYYEVVGDLLSRGFAVAMFDWRGQGGSARSLRDRRKGHVASFADYDRDLDAFMADVVLPDCPPPHFALAHSMGGLICLRAAHDGRVRFPRMVLSAPMIAFGPTRPSQPNACRIAAAVTRMGLGGMSAHGPARRTIERVDFAKNALTGDRARFERGVTLCEKLPEVTVSGPTYGWVHAACRAMREAADPKYAAAIQIPSLFLVGSLEEVVSLRAIERFARGMRSASALVVPGGRHELLMERDAIRAQFWAAFDAFIPGG